MNKSKLGALIMLVALSSLAQASVLSDALDCKKKFDYSAVNAELDRLGTFKSIDNQLVYTLKTPFKSGSAEIAKFTISENLLDGHFSANELHVAVLGNRAGFRAGEGDLDNFRGAVRGCAGSVWRWCGRGGGRGDSRRSCGCSGCCRLILLV